MSHKRMVELQKAIEDAGLKFDCFVDKKDARINARTLGPDGSSRLFSLSNGSKGDYHADKNEFARIRRYARESGVVETIMSAKLKPVLSEFKIVGSLQPKTVEQARIMDAFDKLPRATALSDEQESIDMTQPTAASLAPRSKPRQQRERGPDKIKRLSMEQQFKFTEYLRNLDTEQFVSHDAIAKDAEKVLGFAASPATVAQFVKMLDKKLAKPVKPVQHFNNNNNYTHSGVLAREMVKLFNELGRTVHPDLIEIAKRGVESA